MTTKIRQYSNDYIYSTRYFLDYEKDLQVKYANINYLPHVDVLFYEKKKLLKSLLLSFILFDFGRLKATLRKFKNVKEIINQINQSRKVNILKGSHYLE